MDQKSQAYLVTPADRDAANELGALLGVPGEDLLNEFVEEWDQLMPGQRAEFEQVLEQVNEALPDMQTSIDRIEQSMVRCQSTVHEMRKSMADMSDRVSRIEEALADGLLS
jgi:phage shock protein A